MSSFLKSAANTAGVGAALSGERNTTKEVLNCLRVLQRVLPVIFEGDYVELEKKVLWEREQVSEGASGPGSLESSLADERPQFVIEDDDDDEPTSPSAATSQSQSQPAISVDGQSKTLPPLAERLISCAIDLLFCCGFTLPRKIQVDHYKINYVIW